MINCNSNKRRNDWLKEVKEITRPFTEIELLKFEERSRLIEIKKNRTPRTIKGLEDENKKIREERGKILNGWEKAENDLREKQIELDECETKLDECGGVLAFFGFLALVFVVIVVSYALIGAFHTMDNRQIEKENNTSSRIIIK